MYGNLDQFFDFIVFNSLNNIYVGHVIVHYYISAGEIGEKFQTQYVMYYLDKLIS